MLQLAVIYTRYLLGGAFVFASLIKIKGHRFTSSNGALSPIHSAAHFFETLYQSGLYWQFIGVGQFVAGMLLLTQRYALLGALLFLPIIANVFVITISYDFAFTPVITGAMLLATLGLLGWDWNSLRPLVNKPALVLPTSPLYESRIWEVVGLLLFVYTAGYRALTDTYNVLLWFGICAGISGTGLLVAWSRYKSNPYLAKA
ncbi:hypothetical protein [Hymenobacter cellulosilyticus]|uniref:DoxX family membrane protein n=1 Tax=Hymenobacter cellulosilyticus TaxID=2932248 RepID=A0A8T9Q6B8_9BACT|nr:hypothetical protein [Hymenobacter cellulosilyticus]UOQ73176.1 hypothetical protein MUN79_04165 [Hymenobacter cellulosilyticus]